VEGSGSGGAGLLAEGQRRHPGDFWLCFALANRVLETGRPAEAVGYYAAALAVRWDSAIAHINLGLALKGKGDAEGAIACYQKAIAIDPKLTPAHTNLGTALAGKKDVRGAIVCFKRAVDLDPKNATAHTNLGLALYANGDVGGAIASYRKAIALDPKDAKAHNSLGVALKAKKDVAGAIACYRKAIAADPKDAYAHTNLGLALYDKKDVEGAIACFQKAIAADPKDAEAHYNLGVALYGKKDLGGAIACFQKAIAADPKHAQAHYNLGVALKDKGDLEGAIACFQKAIAANPKDAKAHYNLGIALYGRREVDAAIACFQKAIAADPKHAQAPGALGGALLRQGRFAQARAATRRCLKLLPAGDPLRQAASQQLRQCERMLALDNRLTALLQGQAEPRDAAERLNLADLAQQPYKRQYAAAARLYADAFAEQPKRADDLRLPHRYNGACSALLAAAGQAADAHTVPDKARLPLRRQALRWLQADLDLYAKLVQAGKPAVKQAVRQRLAHWQSDADLASVRAKDALAELPEGERKAWQQLWADVADLLSKAQGK
jgi:tetratricopeptide (TPR) repeat protein